MRCLSSKSHLELSSWTYTTPNGDVVSCRCDTSEIMHDAVAEFEYVKQHDVRQFKKDDNCYLIHTPTITVGGSSGSNGVATMLDVSSSVYRTKSKLCKHQSSSMSPSRKETSAKGSGIINVQFDENTLVSNVNGFDGIALSLVHKDSANTQHFLGQVNVPLSLYPELFFAACSKRPQQATAASR